MGPVWGGGASGIEALQGLFWPIGDGNLHVDLDAIGFSVGNLDSK